MTAPGGDGPTEISRRPRRLPAVRMRTRLARGERGAFETLFKRHHDELYRYCMAILRNRDDAEDALQATMAAALEALPGDAREIEPRPWLFRVAHNKAISIVRRRPHDELPDEPAAPGDGGDAAAVHSRQERLAQLVADLQALPERQRGALVMRELNDLGYGEIAGALGCGEAAARQVVYEARVGLREREEGREMSCDAVQRSLSEGDRRKLRGRRLRAHLRHCDACAAFQRSIETRREDLRTLSPPIPLALATSMIAGLLGGGSGSGAAAGGALAAGAGAGAGGSIAVKGASIAAGVVVAVGAAEVSGVIDLPRPGGGEPDRRSDRRGQPAPGARQTADRQAAPAADVGSKPDRGPDPGWKRNGGRGHREAGRARHGRNTSGGRREAATGAPAGPPPTSDPAEGAATNGPPATGERGRSGAAPGITGRTPGQSGAEPPGQVRQPPGQAKQAPGQGRQPPRQVKQPPGQAKQADPGHEPGGQADTPPQGPESAPPEGRGPRSAVGNGGRGRP